MRKSRTYGSVRGALSNEGPYRDQNALLVAPDAARVDLNIGTSERDLRTADACSLAPKFACKIRAAHCKIQ